MHDIGNKLTELLSGKDGAAAFTARQYLISNTPLSRVVELYLYDNEGRPQNLENFRMMHDVYNNLPRKLLLKCSRKTLKSTLLSNIIALNMIRYNNYHMLYVAPQETSTKLFSSTYLKPRFDSPPLKRILTGLSIDDVFTKKLKDTNSSIILRYCRDDASRMRGPAVDEVFYDETQDMFFEVLPIIKETMALSRFKREIFAGTPLTTDNTINKLWKSTNQLEWAMKCGNATCNHWNTLTEDNDPVSMIRIDGLSCSKCGTLLNSNEGQWVEFNPGDREMVGFHLAQPILRHFNSTPNEWKEIYSKVTNGKYNDGQIFNEVFGLAYDLNAKLITESELRGLCTLGPMDKIFKERRTNYLVFTCGVDWGVGMLNSRTSVCMGGLRDDGVYEVFYMATLKDFDYEKQIYDIAQRANHIQSFCAADSGPDPIRGIKLMQLTSATRTQLVSYRNMKYVQMYDSPPNSIDPSQNRWCLHRSDTIRFTFDLLKKGKVLFPRWEDTGECLQDILNEYVEVKDVSMKQELIFSHPENQPDDFLHALNYAVCQAHLWAGNPLLNDNSSSYVDPAW